MIRGALLACISVFCLVIVLAGLNQEDPPMGIVLGVTLLTVISGILSFKCFTNRGSTLLEVQKQCPMCAEFVKRDAKICKHCRHEFGIS